MITLPRSRNIIIVDTKLKDKTPTITNESSNGKVESYCLDWQQFSGEVELFARNRTAIKELTSFLSSLNGRSGIFEMSIPDMKPESKILGVPVLHQPVNAKATSITLSGFNGLLEQGDYFTLANDSKVYQLLSSGKQGDVFNIKPSLRKTHQQGTPLALNPVMQCRLDSDDYDMKPKKTTEQMYFSIGFKENL
ncbi:hypothetical protein [Shewanella frigidimarina]|uniref:hypothetical protein n=1 Tax=Shewanella frigidimarina TaxID=56812 RepID=UPI003D7BDB66